VLPLRYPLASLWSQDRKTPVAFFLPMAADLIRGVSFLHSHSIAHLDLNPNNLVYDGDFQISIIDFDNAVEVESNDMLLRGPWGTEFWMAPGMHTVSNNL
jgi:serine/threonine protein kinase